MTQKMPLWHGLAVSQRWISRAFFIDSHSSYTLLFLPWSDACCSVSGRTLFLSCGPCLSPASWPALPLASVPSYSAGQGVSGFGSFCRNKRASAAGPKPSITKNRLDTIVGLPCPPRFKNYCAFAQETQDGFSVKNVEND